MKSRNPGVSEKSAVFNLGSIFQTLPRFNDLSMQARKAQYYNW